MPKSKGGEKSLQKARKLRKEMTPQERHLWYCYLKGSKYHWYKQRIIDFYIVDFYCPSAKLVVEIDGTQHFTVDGLEYDKIRTDVIESYDLRILRFSNDDIDCRFACVCKKIDSVLNLRVKAP